MESSVRRMWVMQLLAVLLLLSAEAGAVIVRHDVPDADYVVDDADHPALVDLFYPGDCIGTLVHESYLLTVAHCAMDLVGGESLDVAGVPHVIDDVILHPMWQDIEFYDIALVRFATPVMDVAPLPIYRGGDEVGALVTLVGRGVTATGLEGEAGGHTDGKLRRATNVVSAANAHFIEIVFEGANQDGVTALEGVGAAGDSGCPVFIAVDGVAQIAGLNSYGEEGGGGGIGAYTSRDYQTRVSSYLGWLDGVVDLHGSAPDPGPVAEVPTTERGASNSGAGCSAAGRGESGWSVVLLLLLGARRKARLIV